MTICNMTIEGGGRAGMIAPDETTFEWVREHAGARARPVAWRELRTDDGADVRQRDRRRRRRAEPAGHLGQHARHGRARHRGGPRAPGRRRRARARLHGPGGRHADHRDQARPRLHRLVHEQPHRRPARRRQGGRGPQGRRPRQRDGRARQPAGEGAGRGRGPGRGLQGRRLRLARGRLLDVPGHEPGHRRARASACASTSNRNFEGRQGRGARTHLVSPEMAAAAAIEGHFVDIRDWS